MADCYFESIKEFKLKGLSDAEAIVKAVQLHFSEDYQVFAEKSDMISKLISQCMHKWGPQGEGSKTHEQCIAIAHDAVRRGKTSI